MSATFPPYRAGTGNVCFKNAQELARRGHEVHVFTPALPQAPAWEKIGGFEIHRLQPLARFGNAALLPGLLTSLNAFDLIHLHYPFFGGELTGLVAWLSRTPLIITYHQDVLLSGWMGLAERALRWSIERLMLRRATRLLFTSLDYARASYIQPLLKGRQEHLAELANGVDSQLFSQPTDTSQLRKLLGLKEYERVALLVARLDKAHYFKGVPVFLEALARLSEQPIKGVIVGEGDLRESYEARAVELGIQDKISFVGQVDEADLALYYRLADVTVLASTTMGEAFGLVLLESLASGTPVVATDLPGVCTVVDTPHDGLLVEPGNSTALALAIEKITMADETVRRAMGQHGKSRVAANYDWRVVGNQLEAIYRQVLVQNESYNQAKVKKLWS